VRLKWDKTNREFLLQGQIKRFFVYATIKKKNFLIAVIVIHTYATDPAGNFAKLNEPLLCMTKTTPR
jgi:hypothetical protein